MKKLTELQIPYPFIILGILIVALLLSLKNPYNTQSLIPNLEPYPDTLFYSYPVKNLVENGEFSMRHTTINPKIVTPPGFSLYLLPYFALTQNVLSFFWAQIVLLVATIFVLGRTLKKLLPEHWMFVALPLLFFVTNYYVMTMPSLLMAELISMFVVTSLMYLLVDDVSKTSVKNAGILTVFLTFIKFSNVPLSIVFWLSYAFKLAFSQSSKKYDLIRVFVMWSGGFALLAGAYLMSQEIFTDHKNLQEGSSLSFAYFTHNLAFYIDTLLGRGTRYLWYQDKLVSPLISILAFGGMMYGSRVKRLRPYTTWITLALVALVGFMSMFVTPDARYISSLLPLFAVCVGMALHMLYNRWGVSTMLVMSALFVVLMYTYPAFSQTNEAYAVTLKKQVGLNFLHPEQPWNYIAIEEMNDYVASAYKNDTSNKIFFGSFLPPHYVSYFADGYTAVPLTPQQEFFNGQTSFAVEGIEGSYGSINDLYGALLSEGDVYVTNAYQNNYSQVWPYELEKILATFEYDLVQEGCLGACNIYKLIDAKVVFAQE